MQNGSDEVVSHPAEWRFRALLVAAALGILYVLLRHGLTLFQAVSDNLPLLLPLAVTVLSIFTRATEIKNAESVLKMSNDIAIGIISFDIWAISASRSDPSGRIMVNATTMISGDLVLPFLLAGLLIAVGCVVLTNYTFEAARTRQRWLLGGFVASVLVYMAPFGVKQPVSAAANSGPVVRLKTYSVVIPYQDPEITRFAPTFLHTRWFLKLEKHVEAGSDSAAAQLGLQRFMAGPESNRIRSSSDTKVVVDSTGLVAVER